jgi:dihydrofolate synthase / folylpolyglutamate synthase
MNYPQAIKYLESFTDYEKSSGIAYNADNYDLRRMAALLNLLNNPHIKRKTIHIAGTKGKGSTSAMISNVLSCAGFKTGLFTSPHLVSWQERIAINGNSIPRSDFARLVTFIKPRVAQVNNKAQFGKLTTFEVLTALAFCYFQEEAIDFQVLETGMGGRLDSTNVVGNPDICIITSISMDHIQILGDTLTKIAIEKAGIIKPRCTVISAPQMPEVLKVIKNKCNEENVPLLLAGRDITWNQRAWDLNGQTFSVNGKLSNYDVTIPLLGDYQMENAALAIASIEVLIQKGIPINCTHIMCGLSKVKWPARMQIINKEPLIIIDGAHNPYSLREVIKSIKKLFAYKKVFVIFGASKDKDIKGMAKEMTGFADSLFLTHSMHGRSADLKNLVALFEDTNLNYTTSDNVKEALSKALLLAGKNDLILATGSLFLASDVCKEYKYVNITKQSKS